MLGLRDVCDLVDTWDGGVEGWLRLPVGEPSGVSGIAEGGGRVYGFIGFRDRRGRARAGCERLESGSAYSSSL